MSQVTGLGAVADYRAEDEYRADLMQMQLPPAAIAEAIDAFGHGILVAIEEFALLSDGRRIVLDTQRGYAGSGTWDFETCDSVEADVLTTLLPDDGDEQQPWARMASLLRAQGVDAHADQLAGLDFRIEFTDRLRSRLLANRRI